MEILNPYNLKLEDTILIEASAGTGKTYTITTIYTRLVLQGYKPDSILVVTFTEAAASELKLRIRKRLLQAFSYLDSSDNTSAIESENEFIEYLFSGTQKEIRAKKINLKNAIKFFDEASILTIHAFCLKILKENAFESKTLFDIELSTDSSLLEKEFCFDFFSEHINILDPLFLNYLKKKNFIPEKLLKKFSKLLSRPDITLIPEEKVFINIFDEYRETVKKIQKFVSDKSSDIEDFIINHPGINKQSYKKNSVKIWLEQIKSQLSESFENNVFNMSEKGDSLFKFTLTRLNEKMKSGHDLPEYDFFNLCQKILELSHIFENNLLSLEIEYFTYLKNRLNKKKKNSGIVFFNDLINDLAKALNIKTASSSKNILVSILQAKYNAVLIDEFQDTDQTQYSIFSKLFSGRKNLFCMIGDPKQAIYGFRGGDIFAYLKAVEDSNQVYTLDKNYRSDPMLVKSINTLFKQKTNPFLFDKIKFYPVKTPEISENRLSQDGKETSCFRFLYLRKEETGVELDKNEFIKKSWANDNIPIIAAEDIAKLLKSKILLKNRKIKPSDIAVLVRKNEQAIKIRKSLSFYKIPSHIYSSGSVLESKEAIEMTDLLSAVLEPDNNGFIKAALLTDIFGFTGNEIDDLNNAEGSFLIWHERFKHYHKLWVNNGFIRMIQEIFHSKEAFSKVTTTITERALTNYNHLIEILHYTEINEHLSPIFLLKWFKQEQGRAVGRPNLEELRLETDKSAVSILTIHKSKGLEWPIVFLPYLWDGKIDSSTEKYCLFHDIDDNFKEKFDIGSSKINYARELSENEAKAEEVRLLYVALTRAASMVNIIWGRFNSMDFSALGNILHDKPITDDSEIINDINSLKGNEASGIAVEIYQPTDIELLHVKNSSKEKGEIKNLSRQVFQTWKITSFSSLISNIDFIFSEQAVIKKNLLEKRQLTLKDFPQGAGSGEFFHSVLEDLDFKDNKENILNLIRSKLSSFGYKVRVWDTIIHNAINQILSTPLLRKKNDFLLMDIKKEKRLNEFEFFFPIKSINNKKLYNIFKDYMKNNLAGKYADKLLQLESKTVSGFMKGFIDLIFEHENKWYIVDYKSNFLGASYDDYSYEAMNEAMMEHHYFLQYHIYVVALHKYLMFRKKEYNFNIHFGGVFYLFIRGMHPEVEQGVGVFFDSPDYNFINKLSNDLF